MWLYIGVHLVWMRGCGCIGVGVAVSGVDKRGVVSYLFPQTVQGCYLVSRELYI